MYHVEVLTATSRPLFFLLIFMPHSLPHILLNLRLLRTQMVTASVASTYKVRDQTLDAMD